MVLSTDFYSFGKDLLNRPCLISFVAMARMFKTSAIMAAILSNIPSFGATLVYMSRRQKNASMRSNISKRLS